jgi:hypothetical protein
MKMTTRFALHGVTLAAVGALLAGTAMINTARSQGGYVGYYVSKITKLPGKNPRWDHVSVDPANRNVLIGRRADGLWVYNMDSGDVKQVENTKGTNGAAIAPELGIGMSDNGDNTSVTTFDLKTLAVKSNFKVPYPTDGVGWEPVTKQAYVNNGEQGSFTFFDPVSGKVDSTSVALANTKHPEFFFSDGKGRVFVALQDKNQIGVIDAKAKKLETTWPVDCVQPTGMYYEDKSDRLFVSCRGTKPLMVIVDPKTGKSVTTIPIGTNTDAVLWNPIEKLVMSPNGAAGTLSVIKQDTPDSYHLVETVSTRVNARTGTVDPKTGNVYLVAPESTKPEVAGPNGKAPPAIFITDTFAILELQRGQIN